MAFRNKVNESGFLGLLWLLGIQIAQIFLKLAVFTSENFNKIAPRDRDFHFNKNELKRFWQFIIKKIKRLLESQGAVLWDVRFVKKIYSHDTSDEEN